MQINLLNPVIKEFFKYLGWPLLFVTLWFNGCSDNKKSIVTTAVKVPEVIGKFEPKKPISKPIEIKGNLKNEIKKEGIVYINNPNYKALFEENEKLKSDYSKMSDSLKSKAYDKAIKLNSFSTKFEDENLSLDINGVVRGEVQEITPSYVLKEKTIPIHIKPKETAFRLLGGVEVGNNTLLNDFKVKANLMFQNRKGNIISGSFDTQQTIWIGYNISIFDIKR